MKSRSASNRRVGSAHRERQPADRWAVPTLRDVQRLALSAIVRPLAGGDRRQATWTDGRDASAVAASIIKPNDRLTSFERLEIYNRQYWFRLLDVMEEDFPGLRAVLGPAGFDRLARAYLAKYPS